MKNLIKKIFEQVVNEFVSQTFTLDNVKLVRDAAVVKLREAAKNTENKIDDWAVEVLVRMLSDDNLTKIYDWIIDTVKPLGENRCGFTPEQFDTLASSLNMTPDGCDNVCAAPSIAQIISLLEIVVPILIYWFKTK